MPYSNYFDNPYLVDAYLQTPDYPMNTLDSDSFFDQSLTCAEMASGASEPQAMLNSTLPPTGISAPDSTQPTSVETFNPALFERMAQYSGGFRFSPTQTQLREQDCFSPTTETTSQAPSLCGDAPHQTVSPSLSPHLLNRTSPTPSSATSGSESSTPKRPTRKRGRPKMERSAADTFLTSPSTTSASAITKVQRSKRLPHNQVERKYREGLNSELERLRRAVPMLRGSGDATEAIGQPKPSKAMVLSSAIDYIHRIETERDALLEENERLRRNQKTSGEGKNWDMSVGEDMDGFLMRE